jgi:hypothetical protein
MFRSFFLPQAIDNNRQRRHCLRKKFDRELRIETTRLCQRRCRLGVVAQREYAYGPALGLPDTKVGTLTQALYDEAKKDGWTVISMKNDWKRIFTFE